MGLETPLALLGLLAAVLPWLLHRIRRRDLVPVVLPTFALLLQVEAKKRRSRGLTDQLLLALRIAMIAAACIGIAAPFAVARLSFGDGTIASVAIVLDDSMSMMRREGGETLLATSVERARAALSSLPPGSEVSLVAGGKPARVILRRTANFALAERALSRLAESSLREQDLTYGTRLAAQQLETSKHATRRVLVLSDFAEHTHLRRAELHLEGMQVSVERIGSNPPPANLYFTSLRAVPDPTAKGQTSLAVELGAYGDVPGPVPVRVSIAGREVASAQVRLTAGRGRATLLVPTPLADTDPTALVRIDAADAIDIDNLGGVLLGPSNALQVMLINGDPAPGSDDDELHYAQQALRLAPISEGAMAIRAVDVDTLAKYDLSQVDVVVLANVKTPEPAVAQRLVTFVKRGGGLIIAGGDHVQAKSYDAALAEVLPCKLRARAQGTFVTFEALSDGKLLPRGPTGLAQATAHSRLVMECEDGVYLRFSDGSPAVAAADVERGRSALIATTLDTDWTDLPLRPGYLPLLSRLIRNVAHAGLSISGPVRAGSTVELRIPPGSVGLEVITPEGIRHTYPALDAHASITFDHTESPGPYRVLSTSDLGLVGDVPRAAFVVDSPGVESDLTPIADLTGIGAQSSRRGSAATIRKPLAPFVLLVFGMLVFAEGLLRARRSR